MAEIEENILIRLEKELHDMAQPLTSLQCRLELGKMLADEASLSEAVEGALLELGRVNESFSRLREVFSNSRREHRKP